MDLGFLKTKPYVLALAVTAVTMFAAGLLSAGASAALSGGISTTTASGSSASGEQQPNGRVSAKYDRIWDRTSPADKRWAHRTSDCESGGNPRAIGGGGLYRGAFQFMRSTWKASPKSPGGDPIVYAYRTQAVVAVALKNRDGAGHWPVCG
jgi:resuscitation-promoting factor RpfB